jgi:hypothetical protein
MGQPVEEGRGHLGVAEHGRPLAEGQVGGDDDRAALVEPADQVEQQLATSGEVADQGLVDRRVGEGELVELLGEGQLPPKNKLN